MKSLVEIINEAFPANMNSIFAPMLNAKSQREFGMEMGKLDKFLKKQLGVYEVSNKLPIWHTGWYFVAFDPMFNEMIYGDYKDNYVIKWDRNKNKVSNKYVGPAKFFSEDLAIYDASWPDRLQDVIQDLKYNAENAPY